MTSEELYLISYLNHHPAPYTAIFRSQKVAIRSLKAKKYVQTIEGTGRSGPVIITEKGKNLAAIMASMPEVEICPLCQEYVPEGHEHPTFTLKKACEIVRQIIIGNMSPGPVDLDGLDEWRTYEIEEDE